MENEDKEMDITEDLISDNNPFAKEVLDSSESQETTENATGQLPTHRPRPPQGGRIMAAPKANDARFRSQAL